ncbi:hypothetical protein [Vampirovibrio sp.]|uniref:hypothetical protein n=1 Tax=Vampirovibrio sp. TaxID=2717857 RepID=UPI003593C37C
MLIVVSTVAVLLIFAGWKFRKRAEVHIPLMVSAFVIDFSLLLYIEWTRHAIETLQTDVSTAASEWLLYFHVLVSAIMLVLYWVQIGTGIRLAKGKEVSRIFHKNAAYAFLAFRLLNYVTSFFVA